MASATIGVKVDEKTRERLKALADSRDRSPHWMIKRALAEYLDREEAKELERREDEARWERYVLTGEAVDHDRVKGWLSALVEGKAVRRPR